jgi:hypothetical protein
LVVEEFWRQFLDEFAHVLFAIFRTIDDLWALEHFTIRVSGETEPGAAIPSNRGPQRAVFACWGERMAAHSESKPHHIKGENALEGIDQCAQANGWVCCLYCLP